MKKILDPLNTLLFIIGVFTVLVQIYPPHTEVEQGIRVTLFFGTLFLILVVYLIVFLINKGKVYINQQEENTARIGILEQKMDITKKFHSIDKRLSILELSKKGQIDIRWILAALVLVVFYLYLRASGIVP